MGERLYKAARALCAIPRAACVRELVLNAATARRDGPFILACSHVSHLEPMFVTAAVPRHIRWMSRIEFYGPRLAAAFLKNTGAFPVDRFGNSGPAVRTAVRLLERGEIVGMFPEGGVVYGDDSALRGGPLKQGVCTIAIAAGVPVIPVVLLGTDRLNSVRPWMPIRSARVYMSFGEDVLPPPRVAGVSRRALRREMSGRLSAEIVRTYHGLLSAAGLDDSIVP